MTNFDPQEAERLAEWLNTHRCEVCAKEAATMLRAAIERVRELEDERDEMAPIISRAYELEHRIAAAEKVTEAAREVLEREATGTRETALSLPWWNDLAQALQEYDRD